MNQQMRDLYQASKELNQVKWWEFCEANYPILIKNPQNGEICYCVLMDQSVNFYFGDEGIASYLELLEVTNEENGEHEVFKAFYRQKMIRVTFEDRQDIGDEDYEQIKSSGVSFRGKKQWPVFRRCMPGMVPDFLNDSVDIQFLTIAMEQLKIVLNGVNKGKWNFTEEEVMVASNQDGKWNVDYTDVDEVLGREFPNPYAFDYRNDLKAHRLKKLPQTNVILEGIQFFLPEPYWDDEAEQAVFPLVTAFVEQETGYVCFHDLSTNKSSDLKQINDRLADSMLNELKYRPKEIIVDDISLLEMIEDFCEQINVECYSDFVPSAMEFMNSMLEFRGIDSFGNEIDDDFDFGDDVDFDMDDLSGEMVPQELMDNILQMGHDIYSVMVEMPELKGLPEIQKQAILEVFVYSLVHMGFEYGEMLPVWNEKSFEEFVSSRSIEEDIEPKFKKHIYPSMIKFLECAKSLEMLVNTDVLIKIVHKYYKK